MIIDNAYAAKTYQLSSFHKIRKAMADALPGTPFGSACLMKAVAGDCVNMPGNTTLQPASQFHIYSTYGVSIRSELPLPLPPVRSPSILDLEIRARNAPIAETVPHNFQLRPNPFSAFDVGFLSEGSSYVRLRDVGEFLISKDGRSITGYCFPQASAESFHVYVLAQALSFALVKNGIEPLHATAVVVAGQVVAFLGDCGLGKSTLAAEFLQAGHRLLTDDLLVLRSNGKEMLAYPGPPRIKLFPEMAQKFFGEAGGDVRMNPGTQKLIVPLPPGRVCDDAVPLRAVYALTSPDTTTGAGVRITSLTEREAFIALLASAFNYLIDNPARLRRQFEATHVLANATTVKRLSYPRSLGCLSLVRESILEDLSARSQIDPCTA